jgi:cell division septation protein DedD
MNQDFDEHFEDEEPRLNFITIIIITLTVSGVIMLCWYGFKSYRDSKIENNEIPVIEAENIVTKTPPIEPGGMKIPNMNSKVINNEQNENNTKVERILAAPEEPLSKEELAKHSTDTDSNIKNTEPEQEITSKPNESSNESQKTEEIPQQYQDVVNTQIEEQKTIQPKAEIKPVTSGNKFNEKDFQKKKMNKSYKVQIASFKSEADALRSWKLQSKQAGKILHKHSYHIEQKNLPGKGLVYRLQVGNFEKESSAAELCKSLKSKNIDCFIARP